MPRYLAIDWNPPHLHVLGVRTAKGKATAEQSVTLALPEDLTAATASAAGRSLKDALAQANLAAAPVLLSIPRDRVIVKEISIPFVPPHEEATVVRFQASKEMSEAASDVVLDYALLAPPKMGQTTRVQVVIVRKSIVTMATSLCQSAGLKLGAVVPRPFAVAGLLDRKAPAKSDLGRGVLMAINDSEADLYVYVADRLEWARTLATGPNLAGEVQRNLMLLAAQKSLPEIAKIETAGLDNVGDLGVPAVPLDPWRETDVKPNRPLPFLAPLGLAEAMAKPGGLAVNFADPKQPKPMVDGNAQVKRAGVLAAAALVPIVFFLCYWILANARDSVAELEAAKEELLDKWKKGEQDRTDLTALKEWDDTTISWLDELYDVSARMPHVQGLRVTQFAAAPKARRGGGAKDPLTGALTIHGAMNSDQDVLVQQFLEAVRADPNGHVKTQSPTFKVNEFVVKIDVAPQPPAKYTTKLVVPPQPKKAPEPSVEPTPAPQDKIEGGKTDE